MHIHCYQSPHPFEQSQALTVDNQTFTKDGQCLALWGMRSVNRVNTYVYNAK